MQALTGFFRRTIFDPILSNRKAVLGLDGLRGFCAVEVVADHAGMPDGGLALICVWIFFVISGFLIIPILYRARQRIESGESGVWTEIKRFMRDRAFRILPVYYGFLLVIFLYGQIVPTSHEYISMMRGLPWFLTYTGNFYIEVTPEEFLISLGHFWSLAVEQQFYFLLAPLLLFIPGKRWKPLLGIFAFISLALGAVLALTKSPVTPFNSSFLGFYCTSLGGLAGLSHVADIKLGKFTLESLRRYANPLLIGLLALMCFCGIAEGRLPLINYVTNTGLMPLFATALVISISAFPETGFVRFMETAPMRFVGVVSYGFYVFHLLVLARVDRFVLDHLPHMPDQLYYFVLFLITVPITLIAAVLSYAYFERFFLKMRKGWNPFRRSVKAAAD